MLRRTRAPRRAAFAVLLCAPLAGACAADDPRPATWSFLATEILQPACATAGCHSRLSATAGIVLQTPEDGYRTLVLEPPDGYGAFVVPLAPEASELVHLLRGDDIVRMPPDGPLPEADVELVEAWITAGAEAD
jgi:hypothetical protein